jgi:thioesterase domain-containing protein
LGDDQPFFGLQPPGLDGRSEPLTRVEDLAAYFAAQIKVFQPEGPYIIAGYCAGGTIAFELAQQLVRGGSTVTCVALFGAPFPTTYRLPSQIKLRFAAEVARVGRHARALASLSGANRRLSYIREKLRLARGVLASQFRRLKIPAGIAGSQSSPSLDAESNQRSEVLAQRIKVQNATFAALRRYAPSHFPGRLVIFLPCKAWIKSGRKPLRWRSVADQAEEHYGPTDCHTDVMLLEPNAPIFAEMFTEFCSTPVNADRAA